MTRHLTNEVGFRETGQHQQHFFRLLERLFTLKSDMVTALEEELGVGRNAVYRRLKGDTMLSAGELLHLANVYHIDLNFAPEKSAREEIVFLPTTPEEPASEVEFFKVIAERITFFSSLTDAHARVVFPGLPLSYEMALPTLRAFKIYGYGVTRWRFQKWAKLPFSPQLIHPDATRYAVHYVRNIFDLPGAQLLSPGMLNETLGEIVHFFEIGRLRDRDLIDLLFSELHFMVSHLERMANLRLRFLPGDPVDDGCRPPYDIYRNEIPTASNFVLLTSVERSVLLTMIIKPTFMSSIDPSAFARAGRWYNTMVENATLLGPGADKQTKQFFQGLRVKIDATQTSVHRHLRGEKLYL